jgi:hypothetical protein
MKTTLFTYDTGVGTFWIRPEPARRVRLGINRTALQTYASATAAARAVAERRTGWAEWDERKTEATPPGLKRWTRGSRPARWRLPEL